MFFRSFPFLDSYVISFLQPGLCSISPESPVQSFLVVCHTFTLSHVISLTCLLFLRCVSGYFMMSLNMLLRLCFPSPCTSVPELSLLNPEFPSICYS